MFEYLMPLLWMRRYADTLIARTLDAAVEIQREFGRQHRLPWGISESGYAEQDPAGHYHYQAFRNSCDGVEVGRYRGPQVVSPIFELSRAGH